MGELPKLPNDTYNRIYTSNHSIIKYMMYTYTVSATIYNSITAHKYINVRVSYRLYTNTPPRDVDLCKTHLQHNQDTAGIPPQLS